MSSFFAYPVFYCAGKIVHASEYRSACYTPGEACLYEYTGLVWHKFIADTYYMAHSATIRHMRVDNEYVSLFIVYILTYIRSRVGCEISDEDRRHEIAS